MITTLDMIKEKEDVPFFKIRGEFFIGNMEELFDVFLDEKEALIGKVEMSLSEAKSHTFYKWLIKNNYRVSLISY
tara:strand:- start:179 stop:403 length:225 start_codon:yes stop_codon:yes gene_type:complete